jgi:hypothetical protein
MKVWCEYQYSGNCFLRYVGRGSTPCRAPSAGRCVVYERVTGRLAPSDLVMDAELQRQKNKEVPRE